MPDRFHTLLLLALPASGKSEVRNYLTRKDPEHFHMGPTVQLDDYPYVHFQLCIDELLLELEQDRLYHVPDPGGGRNGPFAEPLDIAGLSYLLAEDYRELLAGRVQMPADPARDLFERLDAASVHAGATPKMATLSPELRELLVARLQREARQIYTDKVANCPPSLEGRTIVIEFARGGPPVDRFPLPTGYGYLEALRRLPDELLRNAAILYIWVTPEESRRKNRERARPDGHGSILFHGTPEAVMRAEYSTCDMAWLLERSGLPGTVRVDKGERVFHVPCERFDNRADLTTFLRGEVGEWTEAECEAIRAGLEEPCQRLWRSWSARR